MHREQLHKFVAKLGTDAIRDDLAAAQAAHASGQDVWKDKEGKATPRSLGGIFIKLCKRRTGEFLAARPLQSVVGKYPLCNSVTPVVSCGATLPPILLKQDRFQISPRESVHCHRQL